jgi:hypothetical protein
VTLTHYRISHLTPPFAHTVLFMRKHKITNMTISRIRRNKERKSTLPSILIIQNYVSLDGIRMEICSSKLNFVPMTRAVIALASHAREFIIIYYVEREKNVSHCRCTLLWKTLPLTNATTEIFLLAISRFSSCSQNANQISRS